MKKLISVLLILVTLFACSCTSNEPKALTCTVDELMDKMSTVNAEGEMMPCIESRLENEFLITKSMYTEGFILIPTESAGVETIAFFKAAGSENAKLISDALDTYIKSTQTVQKDYNAENYTVSLNAKTYTEGEYVYLVMSPNQDRIVKLIGENLK